MEKHNENINFVRVVQACGNSSGFPSSLQGVWKKIQSISEGACHPGKYGNLLQAHRKYRMQCSDGASDGAERRSIPSRPTPQVRVLLVWEPIWIGDSLSLRDHKKKLFLVSLALPFPL